MLLSLHKGMIEWEHICSTAYANKYLWVSDLYSRLEHYVFLHVVSQCKSRSVDSKCIYLFEKIITYRLKSTEGGCQRAHSRKRWSILCWQVIALGYSARSTGVIPWRVCTVTFWLVVSWTCYWYSATSNLPFFSLSSSGTLQSNSVHITVVCILAWLDTTLRRIRCLRTLNAPHF